VTNDSQRTGKGKATTSLRLFKTRSENVFLVSGLFNMYMNRHTPRVVVSLLYVGSHFGVISNWPCEPSRGAWGSEGGVGCGGELLRERSVKNPL